MNNQIYFKNVTFEDINSNLLCSDLEIGEGSYIGRGVRFSGKIKIGKNCRIIGDSDLKDITLGDGSIVMSSYLEDSQIGQNVSIGPFARVRPKSIIENNAKIGNFVEIKKSRIGVSSKAAHLSYIGDADLGSSVNIGCGVIFANYDGKKKYRSSVGKDSFIGCNSNIVSPVKIGEKVFVAAGTTVTEDISDNKFAIGRVKCLIKNNRESPVNRKFFGTDGVRGVYGNGLDVSLAQSLGNALSSLKTKSKIIVGRDTRESGNILLTSFAVGAASAGAEVIDVGVVPTPAISFLVTQYEADFGVVISASHNPAEYNGIKIFGSDGRKISDEAEYTVEGRLFQPFYVNPPGKISYKKYGFEYSKYLKTGFDLSNLKVTLDTAGGACEKFAAKIYRSLGAKVKEISKGKVINDGCGSTSINYLIKNFGNSELGFAFDGDGDRLVAVSPIFGKLDGDKILAALALYYKKHRKLRNDCVVGTLHTNLKIEEFLNQNGIRLLRSNIGDRYVIEMMRNNGAVLGGEQSGHIIIADKLPTGDGILASLTLSEIYLKDRQIFDRVASLELYPQININFVVKDKEKIMAEEDLELLKSECEKLLLGKGRLLLRPSGTEPKIRLMLEGTDILLLEKIQKKFASYFSNN